MREILIAFGGAIITSYAEYKLQYNLYDLITDKVKAVATVIIADSEKVKAFLARL